MQSSCGDTTSTATSTAIVPKMPNVPSVPDVPKMPDVRAVPVVPPSCMTLVPIVPLVPPVAYVPFGSVELPRHYWSIIMDDFGRVVMVQRIHMHPSTGKMYGEAPVFASL